MKASFLLRWNVRRVVPGAVTVARPLSVSHWPSALPSSAPLHITGGPGSRAAPICALTVVRRGHATQSSAHVVHYSKLGMDGFTDVKFNAAADELLESIESRLDELESEELEDVNCSGGVLTIETASKGTFIVNKQAPNVQLWLSSPISGPHHYNMVTSTVDGVVTILWQSDHDVHDLVEKLERELSEVLLKPFQIHAASSERPAN